MTPRVHDEWARRVAAEYGSAAIAAQVLTWSIQAGLPPGLLHTAARIVRDELDHAAIAHGCLSDLGGADTPIDLVPEQLTVPHRDGLLADLTRAVVRNFCIGETLAVPYFAAMRKGCTHPEAAAALERILADEAVHRAFGWDALDALLALDPTIAPFVAAALPELRSSFAGYAAPPDAPQLTTEERGCGLIDHADYAALFAQVWADDIAPRFARRGIVA
jgi:hypothetical protein